MIHRVAFFANKNEIEEQFTHQAKSEVLFEPNYNINPGEDLPVLVSAENERVVCVKKIRWGSTGDGKDNGVAFEREHLWESIKSEKTKPCVFLLSGFYVWKSEKRDENPFFVRMLNSPFMTAAGYIVGKDEYAGIIVTDSNPLIHPMSEKMPLLLDHGSINQWLEIKGNPAQFITQFRDPFRLTDFSVVRVSKKVNDPNNNDSKLIQPIPK